MPLQRIKEARGLYKSAQMFRRDSVAVLSRREVQEAIGPESERLLKLARGAGILAINSSNSHLNNSYARHAKSGVILVPISANHNPNVQVVVKTKEVELGYPVGRIVLDQGNESSTPAFHISDDGIPHMSVVGLFTPSLKKLSAFERAGVMAHEFEHARRFLDSIDRDQNETIGESEIVLNEAPAYDVQFRLLDACYKGLLSEVIQKGIRDYDFNDPRTLYDVDPLAADIIESSGPIAEALVVHMANLACGYDPKGTLPPPRDLVDFYVSEYGRGNDQKV